MRISLNGVWFIKNKKKISNFFANLFQYLIPTYSLDASEKNARGRDFFGQGYWRLLSLLFALSWRILYAFPDSVAIDYPWRRSHLSSVRDEILYTVYFTVYVQFLCIACYDDADRLYMALSYFITKSTLHNVISVIVDTLLFTSYCDFINI